MAKQIQGRRLAPSALWLVGWLVGKTSKVVQTNGSTDMCVTTPPQPCVTRTLLAACGCWSSPLCVSVRTLCKIKCMWLVRWWEWTNLPRSFVHSEIHFDVEQCDLDTAAGIAQQLHHSFRYRNVSMPAYLTFVNVTGSGAARPFGVRV